MSAALSWLGLGELKNLIPGFLRAKKGSAGASGAAGNGSASGGEDRQLRRPAGIRASTMIIPMPELAEGGPEQPRASTPRDSTPRDRADAPRGARSRGSSARPGRSRRAHADDGDRETAPAQADATMHLQPQGIPEETMRILPKERADGPGYPNAEDTVHLGRRFPR